MTTRRSPIERDAREIAAEVLENSRTGKITADEAFSDAIHTLERRTTWAVQAGNMPLARRRARAAELLEDSRGRMVARRGRGVAAQLAALGITNGVKVRDRTGIHAPTDLVLTISDNMTNPYLFAFDDDENRYLVYAPNLQVIREYLIVDEDYAEITCSNCGRDHVPDDDDPTQQDTCWECQQVGADA